jgi:hypothetical protein
MPKPGRIPEDLRSLARAQTKMGVQMLTHIAQESPSHAARVSAIGLLLERGWGKAPQMFGDDGEGSISVIIRHIVESVPAPRIIDHAPLTTNNAGDQSADNNDRDA